MSINKLSGSSTLKHVTNSGTSGYVIESTSLTNGSDLGNNAFAWQNTGGNVTLNFASRFGYPGNPSPSLIQTSTAGIAATTQNWGQTYSGGSGYIKADYPISATNHPSPSLTIYVQVSPGGSGQSGGKAMGTWVGTPGSKPALWATAGAGGGPGSNSSGRPAGYPTGSPNPCGSSGGGQGCSTPGMNGAGGGDSDGSRGNYGGGGGAGYCTGAGSGHCGPLGFRTGGAGGSNGFILGENVQHAFPGSPQPNYTAETRVYMKFTPAVE